jgi:hypothetical protein
MKTFKTFLSEIFTSPVPYKKVYDDTYTFTVKGNEYFVEFEPDDGDYNVTFLIDNSEISLDSDMFGLANVGTDVAVKVFGTVMAIITDFIKDNDPENIYFSSSKTGTDGESRAKLYTSLIKKYCPKEYKAVISHLSTAVEYRLSKIY